MNIAKYDGYFHDGTLIDIKHIGNKITLLMSSAEMNPEDMKDNIPLSSDNIGQYRMPIMKERKIPLGMAPSKVFKGRESPFFVLQINSKLASDLN